MLDKFFSLFVGRDADTSSPAVRAKIGSVAGGVGIVANLALSLLKVLIGVLAASVSILADGLNNLSDAGASIMTLVSFRISAKPADKDHPFGHARMEYICSMIVSFLILVVGFELLVSSGKTLLGLQEAEQTVIRTVTLVVLGASIAVKLGMAAFYSAVGKKIGSLAMKAAASDSLSDCISTSAVLICAVIIKFTDFILLDSIVGLCVALLILWAGLKILNETKNSLLGEAPVEETVDAIRAIIAKHPEALGIHDLIVHNYGPNHYVASLHVEVDGSQNIFDLHDSIDNMERQIAEELGILITIHMDPIVTDDEKVNELRDFVKSVVAEISPDVGIHDFRTVVGATHTNLIFDVCIPFENKTAPAQITEAISKKVLEERPDHYCVITVDRG